MLFFSLASAVGFNADKLLKTITQRFGATSEQKFRDWQKLVADTAKIEDQDQQIKKVNEFWNRRIRFMEDKDAWGQDDYWATPMESLGHGKGDCEDFSIAKYFTLLSAGMDMSQLRLIYVKAKMGGPSSNITQAHMVLAFYSDPEAEPQILDNLLNDIHPASRRQDLTPVFSFNSQGIWGGVSARSTTGSTDTKRLSRWEDLLTRARAEGFE
jgi:predicted transglutaminase-like cysteine proteinase